MRAHHQTTDRLNEAYPQKKKENNFGWLYT